MSNQQLGDRTAHVVLGGSLDSGLDSQSVTAFIGNLQANINCLRHISVYCVSTQITQRPVEPLFTGSTSLPLLLFKGH